MLSTLRFVARDSSWTTKRRRSTSNRFASPTICHRLDSISIKWEFNLHERTCIQTERSAVILRHSSPTSHTFRNLRVSDWIFDQGKLPAFQLPSHRASSFRLFKIHREIRRRNENFSNPLDWRPLYQPTTLHNTMCSYNAITTSGTCSKEILNPLSTRYIAFFFLSFL